MLSYYFNTILYSILYNIKPCLLNPNPIFSPSDSGVISHGSCTFISILDRLIWCINPDIRHMLQKDELWTVDLTPVHELFSLPLSKEALNVLIHDNG
jgi:hypothetical protein